MTPKLEGNRKDDLISKSKRLTVEDLSQSTKKITKGTIYYRLQKDSHGGSSVYFNPNGSDSRFGLSDGTGTMYLAKDPKTALKEVFQSVSALTESDLEQYYMGEITIGRNINIVSMTSIHIKSDITVNDITTSCREETQAFAQKIRDLGVDGLEYTSNVANAPCMVLWSEKTGQGDAGLVSTSKQEPLSSYTINGDDVADVLMDEFNISVEE